MAAATTKTMLMFAVDVGSSMSASVRPDSSHSKLSVGVSFCANVMLQRMIASKTIELGLITFGDEETSNYLNKTQGGYEGVREVLSIGKQSVTSISQLCSITASGGSTGDLIDGIVVAQDALIRVNSGKKYNRLLVIVTDGETPVAYMEDLEVVVAQMKQLEYFNLFVAMVGKVDKETSSVVKIENARLLKDVVAQIGGRYIETDDVSESLLLLQGAAGVSTKPQVTKISLYLSLKHCIPCVQWTKIMKGKLPSLKKVVKMEGGARDTAGDFNAGGSFAATGADADVDGMIKRDTTYRDPQNPEVIVQGDDERVKGYRYGAQFIPLSAIDEATLKIQGGSGLFLLGFLPEAKVARWQYLDSPVYVQGSNDVGAATAAMGALSVAMLKQGQVALVRVVKRDNSDPYLGLLRPLSDEKLSAEWKDEVSVEPVDSKSAVGLGSSEASRPVACFLLHRLPVAEDTREFAFPSLVSFAQSDLSAADEDALQALDRYVDTFTVGRSSSSTTNGVSAATQERTLPFNMAQQGIYDEMLQVYGRRNHFVPVTDSLDSRLWSDATLQQQRDTLAQLSSQFTLQSRDLASARASKKRSFYYSELDVSAETSSGAAPSYGHSAAAATNAVERAVSHGEHKVV